MMPKLPQNPCRIIALTSLMVFCLSLFTKAQIKPTPAADRLKKVQQRKLLENKSLLKDIAFRNIGPTIMSGRVVDLDVNEDDPTEFYAALDELQRIGRYWIGGGAAPLMCLYAIRA